MDERMTPAKALRRLKRLESDRALYERALYERALHNINTNSTIVRHCKKQIATIDSQAIPELKKYLEDLGRTTNE